MLGVCSHRSVILCRPKNRKNKIKLKKGREGAGWMGGGGGRKKDEKEKRKKRPNNGIS